MTKSILFFSEVDLNNHLGVLNKMTLTCNYVNSKFGGDCKIYMLHLHENKLVNLNTNEVLISRINGYLFYQQLCSIISDYKIDFCYLRNPTKGLTFISFIFFLKKIRNRNIRLLVEIPTYPFIQEFNRKKKIIYLLFWPLIKKELKMLKSDLLICSENLINFSNSYSRITNYFIDYPLSSPSFEKSDDFNNLNFVLSANLARWHNAEKMFDLIKRYTGSVSIKFYIISPETKEVKRLKLILSCSKKLNKKIEFISSEDSFKINDIYNNINIGVDSLGRKKSNYSLKSREYASRGIPFIKSHSDSYFDSSTYVFTLNDESTIDEIIKWYKNLPDLSGLKIREEVIKKCSINKVWTNSGISL